MKNLCIRILCQKSSVKGTIMRGNDSMDVFFWCQSLYFVSHSMFNDFHLNQQSDIRNTMGQLGAVILHLEESHLNLTRDILNSV